MIKDMGNSFEGLKPGEVESSPLEKKPEKYEFKGPLARVLTPEQMEELDVYVLNPRGFPKGAVEWVKDQETAERIVALLKLYGNSPEAEKKKISEEITEAIENS